MITADYHTHTIFSHGKGTIEENVRQAEKIGLKEIAITDHGLKHIVFGLRPRKVRKMRKIIDELQKTTNVKILLGVEANLISTHGDIDIKPKQRAWFDVVLCGYHKAVYSTNIIEWFRFIFKNNFLQILKIKQSEKLIEKNTQALINAIKKNKIDILSHVNHDMKVDAVKVAAVAKEYGVYFEINAKKVHVDIETLKRVAATGVQFIVDSDAHTVDRVGEFSLSLREIEEAGISPSQIANMDKLPKFNKER